MGAWYFLHLFRKGRGEEYIVNVIQICRDLGLPFAWRNILRLSHWLDIFFTFFFYFFNIGQRFLFLIIAFNSNSFPFSSIVSLLNHGFHDDILTGPSIWSSFLVHDILGDLGISAAYGIGFCGTSLVGVIDLRNDSRISFGNSLNQGFPSAVFHSSCSSWFEPRVPYSSNDQALFCAPSLGCYIQLWIQIRPFALFMAH